MTPSVILDQSSKQLYNIMMLLTVICSWARFIAIMFVVQAVSKLIMTIFKMFGSATTFLFILFVYLVVASCIMMVLF